MRMKWMMNDEMGAVPTRGVLMWDKIRVVRGRLMWQRKGNFNQI